MSYKPLKTDNIKVKWDTSIPVDNVRTYPKTDKRKKNA